MSCKGYIYKHTNKVNGKVYIGQTTQKPEIRWGRKGSNYSKQRLFRRAISEFGWDNFDHEVLEEVIADNKKDLKYMLNEREAYYILKYESIRNIKGYNTSIYYDKIRTTLTPKARRVIETYLNKGITLEEACKAYINNRETHKINKSRKRRG